MYLLTVTVIDTHINKLRKYSQIPSMTFEGGSIQRNQHIGQIYPAHVFVIMFDDLRAFDIYLLFLVFVVTFDSFNRVRVYI